MRWRKLLIAWWRKWRAPRPLGYRGERAAEKFLRGLGYKIIARGLRLRTGELDLVAVDKRIVVFVEVKTRRSHAGGHPAEAVDETKQRRMTRAALVYLQRHRLLEYASRFDVVAVTWPADGERPQIEHFVAAFEAIGRDSMYS